jgi:hypothetical protein
MKDDFQISDGDLLEYSLGFNQTNGVSSNRLIHIYCCLFRIYHMQFELNYYQKKIFLMKYD